MFLCDHCPNPYPLWTISFQPLIHVLFLVALQTLPQHSPASQLDAAGAAPRAGPPPWDNKQNNFDFIRLSLAILVIYSHAFPLTLGVESAEPFVRLTHAQVTGGAVAVNSFFIISGFLITGSALRTPSVLAFLKKRAARIYPAFLVAAALMAMLVLPLSGGHLSATSLLPRLADLALSSVRLIEFAYTSAFIGNPYPGIINGSLWSISYEFWCYLGIASLLLSRLLPRRNLMAALFTLAWIISILFKVRGWILGGKMLGQIVGPPQFWARLLPLYLAGVVFFLFRERIPLRASLAAASAGALLAASWVPSGWTIAFPIAGTYLIFWFAYAPQIHLRRFGRFGDFSYGTYLYAFPIEQLLVRFFPHAFTPALLFLAAAPLTLLMAILSWYAVERHFLKAVHRPVQAIAKPSLARV